MNILMVGTDDSVFHGDNSNTNTIIRHSYYLNALQKVEIGSTITALIYTRDDFANISPTTGLTYYPVKSPFVQLFPIFGFIKTLRIRNIQNFDLITSQNPFEIGLLALLLKWLLRVPLEIQIHFNFFSPYWLIEHQIINRIRIWFSRYILQQANHIRVVSSSIKNSLVNIFMIPEQTISIIPVPFIHSTNINNCQRNENIDESKDKMVLFVGRLCYQKNLPGLFEVIEIIQKTLKAKFVIIGDGPERDYVEKEIRRLSALNITHLRNLNFEQLKYWYQIADVLLLPSLYEGFGRVLVEGYNFQTPAVATRCGGPEDIIINGKTGFLTEVEDLEKFANKVIWLLDHPEQAYKMGNLGREYVLQEFNPDILVTRMIFEWHQICYPELKIL